MPLTAKTSFGHVPGIRRRQLRNWGLYRLYYCPGRRLGGPFFRNTGCGQGASGWKNAFTFAADIYILI